MGSVRSSWSAWGDALSAVSAVHIATGCSVKMGSSISVSFWLRMPGHGGAGSGSRNGLFCVPWARCTRAVAPCLLCEELAVILVIGGGCGASAHPCEASALGLWSLGSSRPSTRPLGGGTGPGLTWSCSPGHITASDLVPGPWAWPPRLSPAIRLPSVGWLGWAVCVCLQFLKCCLYYFVVVFPRFLLALNRSSLLLLLFFRLPPSFSSVSAPSLVGFLFLFAFSFFVPLFSSSSSSWFSSWLCFFSISSSSFLLSDPTIFFSFLCSSFFLGSFFL